MELSLSLSFLAHSGLDRDTDSGEQLVMLGQKPHNKHFQPFSIIPLKCKPWL